MTPFHALDLATDMAQLHVQTDCGWTLVADGSLGGEDTLPQRLATAVAQTGPVLLRLPLDQAVRVALPDGTAAETALADDPRLTGVSVCWSVVERDGASEIVALPDAVVAEVSTFAAALGLSPAWVTAAPDTGSEAGWPWLGVPLGASAPPTPPWSAPSGPVPRQPDTARAARARAMEAAHRDPLRIVRLHDPLDEDAVRVTEISNNLLRKARRGRWMPGPRPLRGAALSAGLAAALGLVALWQPATGPTGDVPGLPADTAVDALDEVAADAAEFGTAEVDQPSALRPAGLAPSDDPRTAGARDDPVFYTPSPGLADLSAGQDLAGLKQPAIDPSFQADALALPATEPAARRAAPAALAPPDPADAVFVVDARGLVEPSPEGQLAPEGYRVFAGPPPRVSRPRPERSEADLALVVVTDRTALAEDDPLRRILPAARPADLTERFERSSLGGRTGTELATLRPPEREESPQEALANTTSDAPATALATAASPRPQLRTESARLAFATARATRAASQSTARAAPAPTTPAEVLQKAAVQAPTAASPASVQKGATATGRIDLSKLNLLGTYGSSRTPRALVRLPDGRVLNLAVGDQVDGGRVASIDNGRLNYVKSGRTLTLQMPSG